MSNQFRTFQHAPPVLAERGKNVLATSVNRSYLMQPPATGRQLPARPSSAASGEYEYVPPLRPSTAIRMPACAVAPPARTSSFHSPEWRRRGRALPARPPASLRCPGGRS